MGEPRSVHDACLAPNGLFLDVGTSWHEAAASVPASPEVEGREDVVGLFRTQEQASRAAHGF